MVRGSDESRSQNDMDMAVKNIGEPTASLQIAKSLWDVLRQHFTLKIIAPAMLGLISGSALAGGTSSYDLVLEGKKCETKTSDQMLTCEYVVGTGLKFAIVGIGLPDTGITFMKSSFDGDFYASYGLLHGCVIIKRGTKGLEPDTAPEPSGFADYAFVSPKNGKVYESWDECKAAW